jgi:xylan 1,4-beta-xylosidase
VNDAYGTYMALGSPSQLSPAQVEAIKRADDGRPSSSEVVKVADGRFAREFDVRENDVFLLTLTQVEAAKPR